MDISRQMDPKKPLRSLEELLTRFTTIALPSEPKDQKLKEESRKKGQAFRKQLADKLESVPKPAGLPVFGLTYDEAHQICAVLQASMNSFDSSSLIATQIALPTKDQWQYACRAVSTLDQAPSSFHFPAWPTPEGVKSIVEAKEKDLHGLYAEMDQFFDQIKAGDFNGKDDTTPIDLATPDQIVQMMQRFLEAERESETRSKMGGIGGVIGKRDRFVCFLREIIRRSISDRAGQKTMPILFGVSTVENVMEGQSKKNQRSARATLDEMFELLSDVGDASNSIPNNWGITHMMGNVPEWARESDTNNARPLIVGCGVFDDSSKWQRCLVWHVDNDISRNVPSLRFVGVRPVLQRTLNASYRSQLASRMRQMSVDPEKGKGILADLNRDLADVKPLVPKERYDSEIRPFFEYVIAYSVQGARADQRLNRATVADRLSNNSPAIARTQIPQEEFRQFLTNLAFVEGNGTDAQ